MTTLQSAGTTTHGLSAHLLEIKGGLLVLMSTIMLVFIFVTLAPKPQEQTLLEGSGIVAVLPFVQLGNSNNTSNFASNLHADLVSQLTEFKGLKVIAQSSTEAFVDSRMPIYLIDDELGATAYLDGSVEVSEARFSIEVRLVDATDGALKWSRSFNGDYSTDSYFDMQSDILEGVSRTLTNAFSTADQIRLKERPRTALQASEHFYRAKRMFELREVPDYINATLTQLDKALEIEPDYVNALTLKAHVELAQYWYASQGRDWIEKANETLLKAEGLAPNNAGVLVVRGYYHYWGFRDYDKASETLDQAMSIGPNRSDVWELSAYVARRRGEFRDALSYLSQARELNPLDLELVTEVIETQATLGALQDTISLGEKYLQRHPNNYDLIDNLDRMWRLLGEPERAFAVLENGVSMPNWGYYSRRVRTAVLTQNINLIGPALDELRAQSDDSIENFLVATMYAIDAAAIAGDTETVLRLQEDIRQRVSGTPFNFQSDWTPNGHWTPVDVPSYLGDIAGVQAVVSQYEDTFVADYWQTARHWSSIARALARVGLNEQALDYIEQYVILYGPLSVQRFESSHVFDEIRQSSRYQKLIEYARSLPTG